MLFGRIIPLLCWRERRYTYVGLARQIHRELFEKCGGIFRDTHRNSVVETAVERAMKRGDGRDANLIMQHPLLSPSPIEGRALCVCPKLLYILL